MRKSVLLAALLAGLSTTAQAYVTVHVETSPTQQAQLGPGASVENFSSVTGGGAFVSTFGGSGVKGIFTGFGINTGTGNGFDSNHVTVTDQASILLSRGVKYFGLRAAALDGNNTIELLRGGQSLGWFNLVDSEEKTGLVSNALASSIEQMIGGTGPGPFTYVNFFSENAFDEIRFTQSSDSFSLDDVSLANAVPEPATWAMMIIGFGAAGAVLRRRNQGVRFA